MKKTYRVWMRDGSVVDIRAGDVIHYEENHIKFIEAGETVSKIVAVFYWPNISGWALCLSIS